MGTQFYWISQKMFEFTTEQLKKGNFPIVHGVFGGKTGVRDQTMPGSMNEGGASLGVVDACQGRFSLEELHQWLDQDSVVLFTTSKFYQVSHLHVVTCASMTR